MSDEAATVDESDRLCTGCSRTWPARSDQGLSVDVHGECLACWGPRLHGKEEGAARYRALIEEAVRRGWMQPPGEGATLDGTPGTVGEVDVGTLILQKLDAILAEQAMQRLVAKHVMARLYGGRNAPPVPPELWEWLGIETSRGPTIYTL